MKKLIATLILFACVSASAQGYRISFLWDNNSESDLAGYKMYMLTPPATNWLQVATSITNTVTITNTVPTLSKYRVTAFNTSNIESIPSNEITVNLNSPGAPGKFKLQSIVITLAP